MKKAYIIPEINVVKVELSNMVAESLKFGGSDSKDTATESNGGFARENNAWDIWDNGGDDFEE